MTIRSVHLKPASKNTTVGKYDLDGFAVEYDDVSHEVDFRLQLGDNLDILSAFPVGPSDRLRLLQVDSAVSYVDEPALVEDPWIVDISRLEWEGEPTLETFPDGAAIASVVFESSKEPAWYRCEIGFITPMNERRLVSFVWGDLPRSEATSDDVLATTTKAQQLVDAVYERPHDEALRIVCADALTEAGDPRGELFALDVALDVDVDVALESTERELRGPLEKRRDEILAKHGRRLLGALGRVSIDDVRFSKGFVDRLTVRGIPLHVWREIEAAPEVSTVRALELVDLKPEVAREVIASLVGSRFRSLRELRCTTPLDVLQNHSVEVQAWLAKTITRASWLDECVTHASASRIGEIFPALTHLGFRWPLENEYGEPAFVRLPDDANVPLLLTVIKDGLPNLEQLELDVITRVPGFASAILDALGRFPKHVTRIVMNVGPEGFVLERTLDAPQSSTSEWKLEVVARNKSFDATLVKALLADTDFGVPLSRNDIVWPAQRDSPETKF